MSDSQQAAYLGGLPAGGQAALMQRMSPSQLQEVLQAMEPKKRQLVACNSPPPEEKMI